MNPISRNQTIILYRTLKAGEGSLGLNIMFERKFSLSEKIILK